MRASDRFRVEDVACRLADREARVLNLSVSGFYVASDDPAPPPGQFVEVDLRLGTREWFRLVGKVAWRQEPVTAHDGEQPPGFGVKITRIDLRDKIALVDWLRRREGEAPARRAAEAHAGRTARAEQS